MVGPLWNWERPKPGVPAQFQVLGGLLARDSDYERELYRYRIFWLIPLGTMAMETDMVSKFELKPIFTEGEMIEAPRDEFAWAEPPTDLMIR